LTATLVAIAAKASTKAERGTRNDEEVRDMAEGVGGAPDERPRRRARELSRTQTPARRR
jgi:hypothetical protein